jgi:hypothetical protein
MFLDIIHRPVYISKHNVSETGFCLRLQVGNSSIDWAQLSRFSILFLSILLHAISKTFIYNTVRQHCNELFLISFTFTLDTTCLALNGHLQVSY